jgi:hypothetical protein
MPSLTPDTLLQRAIPLAIKDRVSFAEAYNNEGEYAADALATAKRILALKGRKLAQLDEEELRTAFATFVFAEQWEESLADSNPGKRVETQCRRNLTYFRALRNHLWGRSKLEAEMEDASPVQVWPPSKESLALMARSPTGKNE